MGDHPAFFWGRANGWALLTMTEVLDVMPTNHPQREKLMNLFREHVRGLAALQSGEGFWHQLLDRNDSCWKLQQLLSMFIASPTPLTKVGSMQWLTVP